MTLHDIFLNQEFFVGELKNIQLPTKNYDLIRESALGIFAELGEVLSVDKNWKTWRTDKHSYDENDLKEEIADVWIFLINLTLSNNIDSDEIIELINKKQRKNLYRFLPSDQTERK